MALNKSVYINCANEASVTACIKAGTAATGADTAVTHFQHGPAGIGSVLYNTGTNNGRIVPTATVDGDSVDGWAMPSTDSDNVGGTWTFGGSLLSTETCPLSRFTVGTDPAFFMEVKMSIPNVSDYDVLGVGFVEPAASYVAAIDTVAELQQAYDEKAMICLADTAGDIDFNTSLAGVDVNTDTDFTDWVDDAVKTLRVNVSAAGAVTYTIGGVADGNAVAFSFADTTVVQPCIIFAKGAAVTDTPPQIAYIKWGHQ